MRYTLKHLDSLPTLSQGHVDDLKIDNVWERIWLSRLTRADGVEFDHMVTVERLTDDGWAIEDEYAPA